MRENEQFNLTSSVMRKELRDETAEVSLLTFVRRASAEGDQQAWTAVQHSLQATVLAWLRAHPGRAVVRTEQDDQSFVDQVFAEAWQAVRQGQLAFQSLSEVLLLLWASLNGAIWRQYESPCIKEQ